MKENSSVPNVLETTLLAGRGRIRRILAVRGICTTLAVFVVSTLGVMAIDAMVTIFSSWIRWLLWLGVVAATGATASAVLVKPLRRLFTLAEIASLIERNHPELEERLSTAVELAQECDAAALASPELVAAIARAAAEDIRKVSPRREFTSRTVKPRLWAVLGAVLVLGGLFVAFPTATTRLVTRALVPSAEVDNVYASALRVTPGDRVVLAGTSVEIGVAVDEGFPSRAFVRTSVGGRSETSERMTRTSAEGEPARYAFVYPSVSESFVYRVHCGSALTRGYRIQVVPAPTYTDRRITVEHPAYTGRPADTYTNSAAVVGVAGSKVKISVRRSRPDVRGEVVFSDGRRVAGTEEGDRIVFPFELKKDGAGSWRSEVCDSYGFSNTVESAAVEIVKDTPPEVKLVQPEEREVKLPRAGVLPLEIVTKDDFGVARRKIEICVGAGAWADLREMDGDSEKLLVSALPLGDAATFRVRVRVEDNLPPELGGPNVANSEEVQVELRTHGAKSLARQGLAAEIAESKKAADDIRKHLERAYRCLGVTKNLAGEGWAYDNAKKHLAEAKDELTNGEGLLAEFIEQLKEGRLATGAEMFAEVEDKNVSPLRRDVEDIYVLESRKEQGKAGAEAEKDGQKMLKAFDEAMRRFSLLTKKAEDLQKLEDLAEREKALAEAAESGEMSAEDIAKAEKELEKELAEEIREEKSVNLDHEKKVAENLLKRAEDLEKRQDAVKKMTGDEQKNAENALANDLQRLANETGDLKREIERKTGAPETDANKTSAPVEAAQNAEQKGADDARAATQDMEKGDSAEAKSHMDAVSDALKQAQQSLADVQKKIDAKNAEFGQNVSEMTEAQSELGEAREAAEAAAQQEAADAMSEKLASEMERAAGLQARAEELSRRQEAIGQMSGEDRKNAEQQLAGDLQKLASETEGLNRDIAQKTGAADKNAQEAQAAEKSAAEHAQKASGDMQRGDEAAAQKNMQAVTDALAQAKEKLAGLQQQGQQSPQARQKMGEALKKAGNALKQMAQSRMEQSNMDPESFDSENDESEGDESSASQASQQPNPKAKPGKNHKSGKTPKARKSALLKALVPDEEGDSWFRMKGESAREAASDAYDDVPAEYRSLVRDYFKALNEGDKK